MYSLDAGNMDRCRGKACLAYADWNRKDASGRRAGQRNDGLRTAMIVTACQSIPLRTSSGRVARKMRKLQAGAIIYLAALAARRIAVRWATARRRPDGWSSDPRSRWVRPHRLPEPLRTPGRLSGPSACFAHCATRGSFADISRAIAEIVSPPHTRSTARTLTSSGHWSFQSPRPCGPSPPLLRNFRLTDSSSKNVAAPLRSLKHAVFAPLTAVLCALLGPNQ